MPTRIMCLFMGQKTIFVKSDKESMEIMKKFVCWTPKNPFSLQFASGIWPFFFLL